LSCSPLCLFLTRLIYLPAARVITPNDPTRFRVHVFFSPPTLLPVSLEAFASSGVCRYEPPGYSLLGVVLCLPPFSPSFYHSRDLSIFRSPPPFSLSLRIPGLPFPPGYSRFLCSSAVTASTVASRRLLRDFFFLLSQPGPPGVSSPSCFLLDPVLDGHRYYPSVCRREDNSDAFWLLGFPLFLFSNMQRRLLMGVTRRNVFPRCFPFDSSLSRLSLPPFDSYRFSVIIQH